MGRNVNTQGTSAGPLTVCHNYSSILNLGLKKIEKVKRHQCSSETVVKSLFFFSWNQATNDTQTEARDVFIVNIPVVSVRLSCGWAEQSECGLTAA